MALSFFDNKSQPPMDADLAAALDGPKKSGTV